VGGPWAVQATMMALVYPIVLSFVALMLQRRAHSTAALRVYILDSAVVPAGASSIGLLMVLGLQYFVSPYVSTRVLSVLATPLIVMSGAWMFVNILLAGVFLFRTIRFLQKEEEELAFTRVAVDIVLRAQFTEAIKRNVVHGAPQRAWGFPAPDFLSGSAPQVRTMLPEGGRREVQLRVASGQVLHDVHLGVLRFVARSWSRRAAKMHAVATKATQAPSLVFLANVGAKHSGVLTLCEVKGEPKLSWWQRILTKASFVYRSSRSSAMHLSIDKMLGEMGNEAAQAAEQSRQAEGVERLKDMVALHRSVLRASTDESGARSFSLAMLETERSRGNSPTFSASWIEPYRALNQLAVRRLEEDDRFFKALSYVPTWLSSEMIASPVEPLMEVQQLGSNLVYELGRWWTRKADASMLPGERSFSGTLPNPANKVYEQAIVQFLGGWGNHRVSDPRRFSDDDSIVWRGLCGRANIYANHLERSANMFLQAVSRGDEVGSVWFADGYLKWLSSGIRGAGLTHRRDERMLRHATMSLTELSWSELQEALWEGGEEISIDIGERALGLAVRRYWESMRLYLMVMLIEEAGAEPEVDSRELRMAAALVTARGLRRGGTIKASAMSSVDDVLHKLLSELFGIRTAVGRLDAFAEKLSLHDNDPVVPGWVYSWSYAPAELEALTGPLMTLLLALSPHSVQAVSASQKLIQSLWRDVDKLSSVKRHLQLLVKELQNERFAKRHASVAALTQAIERAAGDAAATAPISTEELERRQASLVAALNSLVSLAERERDLTMRACGVDGAKVHAFANAVAQQVFGPSLVTHPVIEICYSPNLPGTESTALLTMPKRVLLANREIAPGEEEVTVHAEQLRELVRQLSAERLPGEADTMVIQCPEDSDEDPTVEDQQNLILRFAAACVALRERGEAPVILVGDAIASRLEPYAWGTGMWASPLPEGVALEAPPAEHSASTVSLINGAPVVRYEIPRLEGYVLPERLIQALHVRGSSAANAFVVSWREVGTEQVEISLKWSAHLGVIPG